MSDNIAKLPLITSVSQFEVDFIIPLNGIDLRLGIDPFLLYKSRDEEFKQLHSLILKVFNETISCYKQGNRDFAQYILNFPEVSEIGLGYSKSSKDGSGAGTFYNALILDILSSTPDILDRGFKHIEELQLLSTGIGADRISDIVANLLKQYLIEYTQKQCELWNIPLMRDVPISHIFDSNNMEWFDGYFDLPLSPFNKKPILLVPRRIIRILPWINYNDFYRLEFTAFLRAKKIKKQLNKNIVIETSRKEIERIDRYIKNKEATANLAEPSINYLDLNKLAEQSDKFKKELQEIPSGTEHSTIYQNIMLSIFNYLFEPDLTNGKKEVATIHGTERRDIIFTNESDKPFFSYLRNTYKNLLIMFEAKNVSQLSNNHYAQTATYLGDKLGHTGFILTRNTVPKNQILKAISIFNNDRKVILALTDEDINFMLDLKKAGRDPMAYLTDKYREFKVKIQ